MTTPPRAARQRVWTCPRRTPGAAAEWGMPVIVVEGLREPGRLGRTEGWRAVGAYSSESARGRLVRRCERSGQVVLNGDQLGDLGNNVCDRILRRVQPIS